MSRIESVRIGHTTIFRPQQATTTVESPTPGPFSSDEKRPQQIIELPLPLGEPKN